MIKLSQYSNAPAQIHYEAVKDILIYLRATPTEGLYFWQQEPNKHLPEGPMPHVRPESCTTELEEETPHKLTAACNSNWASDTTH